METTLFIRFVTGDDDLQAKKVYNTFKNVELETNELFVPSQVLFA